MFALASCGAAVLYAFPPERYGSYPVCPVFHYAHILCPGCGATRAMASLLHGNLAQAWHYNALFVAILPLLLFAAFTTYWSAVAKERVEWPQVPKSAIVIFFVVACAFTIIRNVSL
jgi:hypothetical protein